MCGGWGGAPHREPGMMTEGAAEQKEGKGTLVNTNRAAFLWNKRTDVPFSHRISPPPFGGGGGGWWGGGVSHLLNIRKQTQT